MGLRFSATQPDKPWPTGISSEENRRIILAGDVFRDQHVVAPNPDGQRVMRNDFAQPHRQHRQRFIQAERISQILRDLKQRLHFLPRGGDGIEEVHRTAGLVLVPRLAGRGLGGRVSNPAAGASAALDLYFHRKLFRLRASFPGPCVPIRCSAWTAAPPLSGSKAFPDSEITTFMASSSGRARRY